MLNMSTIKSIDGKSLIIGDLLASIIFLGVAAVSEKQQDNAIWNIAWHPVDHMVKGEANGKHS